MEMGIIRREWRWDYEDGVEMGTTGTIKGGDMWPVSIANGAYMEEMTNL